MLEIPADGSLSRDARQFFFKLDTHNIWVQRRVFTVNRCDTVFIQFIRCQMISMEEILREFARLHNESLGYGKWIYSEKYGDNPIEVRLNSYRNCRQCCRQAEMSPWSSDDMIKDIDQRLYMMENVNWSEVNQESDKPSSFQALGRLQLEIQMLETEREVRDKRIRFLLASFRLKYHLLSGANKLTEHKPPEEVMAALEKYRQLAESDKTIERLDETFERLNHQNSWSAHEITNLLRFVNLTARHVLYLSRRAKKQKQRRKIRKVNSSNSQNRQRNSEKGPKRSTAFEQTANL